MSFLIPINKERGIHPHYLPSLQPCNQTLSLSPAIFKSFFWNVFFSFLKQWPFLQSDESAVPHFLFFSHILVTDETGNGFKSTGSHKVRSRDRFRWIRCTQLIQTQSVNQFGLEKESRRYVVYLKRRGFQKKSFFFKTDVRVIFGLRFLSKVQDL